ncbi:hypothetical protein PFISCL1PPCAC_19955, partial [Pristionchus fissidentatus]
MFSSARVVALLAHRLGIDPDVSSASREERKLADRFVALLKEAEVGSLFYDEKEEMYPLDVEDYQGDPEWTEEDLDLLNDPPNPDRKRFHFSKGNATLETILLAAKYYRSTTHKAHRSLDSMKNTFRFIGHENDLRKMELFAKEADEQSTRRVGRILGLQLISNELEERARKEMEDGFSLHDVDLMVMAMEINREGSYVDTFQASSSFVDRFKRKARIGSRHITKFIAKRNHVEEEKLKKEASDFVASIKIELSNRLPSTICNADQTGFLKEMHSKRSLAPIGDKTVVRCVQSKSSLTHSYTVM